MPLNLEIGNMRILGTDFEFFQKAGDWSFVPLHKNLHITGSEITYIAADVKIFGNVGGKIPKANPLDTSRDNNFGGDLIFYLLIA